MYGYGPLLSREEIERFGVKAFDESNVKVDCVTVAVAHDEFKKINLKDMKEFMNDKPVIVDARGMFDEGEAKGKGFYYESL